MATRTRGSAGLFMAVAVVLALVGAGAYVAEGGHDRENTVPVAFVVELGDGYSWAGGGQVIYRIGDKTYPAKVVARPQGDHKIAKWSITKRVLKGTAVALTVTADWPRVPEAVTILALNIPAKPVRAVGPAPATTTAYIN